MASNARMKQIEPLPNSGTAPTHQIDATSEAVGSLTPELVVALCGPIGSPLHAAAEQVQNALREFGYLTEQIRLSDLIRLNASVVNVQIDKENKRKEIESLIAAGDHLRDQYGKDVLAKLAVAKIGADRRKKYGEFDDAANEAGTAPQRQIRNQRICHVVDSIKNDAELDLLRLIYGDALFAVGVFSPLEIRERNLLDSGRLNAQDIQVLIDMDSGEEFAHGQSVRNTFPRCDFFMRVDDPVVGPTEPQAVGQLVEKLRRFFSLVFRSAVVTPTTEETAMYAAASAARNSACISRQVGAAVISESGELISVGWNDVPRNGGGLYGKMPLRPTIRLGGTALQLPDERCFAQSGAKCHNDLEKTTIASRVVETLVGKGLLDRSSFDQAVLAVREDSGVRDLIEFSRAVHAEMHAILGASRVAGDRILGSRLFVTTYPCHACARHIVAAGVADVIYIEPYRKSMATRLHKDTITESVSQTDGRVRLLQFDGVAPRRFIDLFEAGSRKHQGVLRLNGRSDAIPSTHVSLKAIPRLEEVVVAEVREKRLMLPVLVENEGTDGKKD